MPDEPKSLPQGRDVSVPIEEIAARALGLSVLMLALPLLFFVLVWGLDDLVSIFTRPWGWLRLLVGVVLFTAAHEGFHAVGWKYWGSLRWTEIKFGIKWEAAAPYTHATVPMRADAYRFGAALPGIMTGIVPYLAALALGNGGVALISAVMISGAVGDVYVLWIMRQVAPDAQVIDHPDRAGCIVVDEGSGART